MGACYEQKKPHFSVLFHLKLDIFNSLLSLSLSYKIQGTFCAPMEVNYRLINYSESIPVGSLLESASDSDSESNEFKNV